jgi:hypothetical protein
MNPQPPKDPVRRGEDIEKEEGKEAGRHRTDDEQPPSPPTPPDTTGVDPADADPRSRKHTEAAD